MVLRRSFGVLFYEFVTGGSVPYGDMTNAETRKRVTTGYRLPQPHDCPDEFHSVMVKCWSKSPSSRPSFSAILSDLAKDRAKFVRCGNSRIFRGILAAA